MFIGTGLLGAGILSGYVESTHKYKRALVICAMGAVISYAGLA